MPNFSSSAFPFLIPQRDQRILAVDSGCGGVTVMERCQRQLPAERITLIADNAGHPYGDDKTLEQVADNVVEACAPYLESGMFKAVQVACNTASHPEILARLTHSFGVQAFGLIEPAARELLCRHGYGRSRPLTIAVMGTPALLKYRGYHQALQAQAAALGLLSPIVIDVPCRGLAAAIEKDIHGKGTHLPSLLASYLQPLPQAEVLILACTHFCLHSVRRMIADIAGPGVTLFDPADAAAANLFTWLRNHKLESAMPPEAMPDLRTSREDPALVHRMRDAWLLHRRVS